MSIRAVAKAAYENSQTDNVNGARQAMIDLLGDPDSEFSTMELVAVEAPPEHGHTLVVFADDDSDIHLGVRKESDGVWSVWLIHDDGGWTILGEQIRSLEHLWTQIDAHMPTPAVEAWATQTVYAVGDVVSYDGLTYECIQGHTSQAGWEPPNVPALWVRA